MKTSHRTPLVGGSCVVPGAFPAGGRHLFELVRRGACALRGTPQEQAEGAAKKTRARPLVESPSAYHRNFPTTLHRSVRSRWTRDKHRRARIRLPDEFESMKTTMTLLIPLSLHRPVLPPPPRAHGGVRQLDRLSRWLRAIVPVPSSRLGRASCARPVPTARLALFLLLLLGCHNLGAS
jgi:hypothetical protein